MDPADFLAKGVLDVFDGDPSELRFRLYILYVAAQRLTWLDHTGERKLDACERTLCDFVEDCYRGLEADAN